MTDNPAPYTTAFYEMQSEDSRASAAAVFDAVLPLLGRIDSCLDVGCGVGSWLSVLAERGIRDLQGVDGSYVDRGQLRIPPESFRAHDLSTTFFLDRHFDLAISVEVAEHVGAAHADAFVGSIAAHSDLVLFSAAVPGQSGVSHINCQWPTYWQAKFASRGYTMFDIVRPLIWDDERVGYWYRQNLLLFARNARAESLSTLNLSSMPVTNVVHPASFAFETRPDLRPPLGLRALLREIPGAVGRAIDWHSRR